jgi:hypothetical protein
VDKPEERAHKLVSYMRQSENKHCNKEQIDESADKLKELLAPLTRKEVEETRAAYKHITGGNMRADIVKNEAWAPEMDAIVLYTKGKDRLSPANIQHLAKMALDENNEDLFFNSFNQAEVPTRLAMRSLLDAKGVLDVGNSVYTIDESGELKKLHDDRAAFRALFPKDCDNINQGTYGTCYLDASLLAIGRADFGEIFLAKMIKADKADKNGKDGWNVSLPSSPDKPFHITRDDIDNYFFQKTGVNAGLGIRILEAAYGKQRVEQGLLPKTSWTDDISSSLAAGKLGGTKDHFQAAGTGGYPSVVMEDLIGKSKVFAPAWNEDNVKRALDYWATKEDRLAITASTNSEERYTGDTYYNWNQLSYTPDKENQIVFGHAYTVVDIDPDKQQVKLANPWDSSQPFTKSYKEFYKYFAHSDAVEVPSYR